jgi:organic radical activating enzyme
MNCEILHTLYVRSNGDVPCNDDAGEQVLLGRIDLRNERWRVGTLLTNYSYRRIREAWQEGVMPWPNACVQCAFFRPKEEYRDPLAQKQIRKLQIEPSVGCRLRCPGCLGRLQARIRSSPLHMDLRLFERVLRSLREEGYSVGEVEYCGQGEPLLHPEFPEFVRRARSYYPNAVQRLITSGNFEYQAATQGEWIDEIMVSCDGLDQASYEQYRIGGHADRAIQFMRDAPRTVHGRQQSMIWKYILFEYNDSDDEIRRAQQLAQELAVHAMLFVFTHSKEKSHRYTPRNVAEFPIAFPNVFTNATPIHYRYSNQPVPSEAIPPA